MFGYDIGSTSSSVPLLQQEFPALDDPAACGNKGGTGALAISAVRTYDGDRYYDPDKYPKLHAKILRWREQAAMKGGIDACSRPP